MTIDRNFGFHRWMAGGLVAVVLAFMVPSTAAAKYASLIINADSGKVLHSANADVQNHPASLTKMMTLYLTFQALESHKLTMTTPLKVSKRAAAQAPSKLGLAPGGTILVREAILGLVTKSANDAAVVMAEALGGSEANFALRMTDMAHRLGMRSTTFRNASGLPNPKQVTTARDMAKLAVALMRDYPKYYHFFSTESFEYKGQVHHNHNHMLTNYDGIDGIKTGFIQASGFNLVASAKRDGHRLIGVVFGGQSAHARDLHMASLLDRGFRLMATNQSDPETVAEAEPAPESAVETASGSSEETLGDADPEPEAKPAATHHAKAADTTWTIQVGAYNKYQPALERARKAVSLASASLDEGEVKVVPLKRGKKKAATVYRSRIQGLTRQQAINACAVLSRKHIPCMELHEKDGEQVASTR